MSLEKWVEYGQPTNDFVGRCRRVLSEMNKCLTLVHLTSTFRIQSGRPETSGLLSAQLLRGLAACSRLV